MNATSYQRVRLWSGIFSIGANLGLVWALYILSLGFSGALLRRFDARLLLILPVLAMLALGLVFDILSGHAVETALGRTRQPFANWLRDWMVAALRAGVGLYFALLFLGWLRFTSTTKFAPVLLGAGAFFTGFTLCLPLFLPRSWRADTDQTRAYSEQLRPQLEDVGVPRQLPIVWIEAEDETTVNGAVPPLGRAQIWLSTNVVEGLTPRQSALLVRRDWWFHRTGKHLIQSAICVSWLLAGLVLARAVPASDVLQGALGGAAIMTSWCFAALLVWPRLNSVWTRAADRDLLQVAEREEIAELLRRVQSLNSSDESLGAAKAGVFHPIPDLNRRLDHLSDYPRP